MSSEPTDSNIPTPEETNEITIWFKLPYMGLEGERIVKKCIRRLKPCFKKQVRFRVIYGTKRVAMFCSNKDKIPNELKSNCVYEFKCPGCSERYIGKTDRNFLTRVIEHGAYRKDQNTAVYKHLISCDHFNETLELLQIPCENTNSIRINIAQHLNETAKNSIKLLRQNNDWRQLCFLEALYIRQTNPELNNGLKATKELQLFK